MSDTHGWWCPPAEFAEAVRKAEMSARVGVPTTAHAHREGELCNPRCVTLAQAEQAVGTR